MRWCVILAAHGEGEYDDHRGRRARGARLEPGKVYFPAHDGRRLITKLDLVDYYLEFADAVLLGVCATGPTVMKRWDTGSRRSRSSRSACPRTRPTGCRPRPCTSPSGRSAHGARAQRRRPPRLGGEPRRHRLQPVAGAPRRPRPPRRAARRPRPDGPASSWDDVREVAMRVARGAAPSTGCSASRRRAGRAGIHVNVRIEPRWTSPRCAARRSRSRARSSGGCPAARHDEVVEGGAPRRVRRLQPERARPHGRLRRTRCARCPTRACPARCVGRGGRRRARGPDASTPCPSGCASVGDPLARRSTTSRTPARRCSTSRARDEEEGLGDAPWPPHFRKQPGEPKRVQPSRAKKDD